MTLKSYQSHGVKDLLQEDLHGLHTLLLLKLIGTILAESAGCLLVL